MHRPPTVIDDAGSPCFFFKPEPVACMQRLVDAIMIGSLAGYFLAVVALAVVLFVVV